MNNVNNLYKNINRTSWTSIDKIDFLKKIYFINCPSLLTNNFRHRPRTKGSFVRAKFCYANTTFLTLLAEVRVPLPFGYRQGHTKLCSCTTYSFLVTKTKEKNFLSKNILRIINKVEKTIKKKQLIESSNNILLMISGGQDSIFLLFCLSFLHSQISFKAKIIWCNHFWQICSFYTTLHLTKSSVAFSYSIIGFLPFQVNLSLPSFWSCKQDKDVALAISRRGQDRSHALRCKLSYKGERRVATISTKLSLPSPSCACVQIFLRTKLLAYKCKARRTNLLAYKCKAKRTNLLAEGLQSSANKSSFGDLQRALRASSYKSPCVQVQSKALLCASRKKLCTCTQGALYARSFVRKKICLRSFAPVRFAFYSMPIPMPMQSFLREAQMQGQGQEVLHLFAFHTSQRFVKHETWYRTKQTKGNWKQKSCSYCMEQLLQAIQKKKKGKGYKRFIEEISETRARNWRHITTERASTFYNSDRCIYGHTASDRIETVLFNLIRGSRGIQSLPWKRRHSTFSYNNFYPFLEGFINNTHISFM